MKRLYLYLLLFLISATLKAASPAFNSFEPTQFDTNSLAIKYRADWTNDLGVISPVTINSLVTMTNENVYGTWSTPSKVTLLSLGTNQLDMTLQSAWLLNSPTNDATQVILSLSAGAYQGQHAFLLSQNGGEGFTLPNLSEQYDVPGALVVIGSDWVGTTNRGIHLVYSAPDWVLEGIPTDPSVPGGGGGGDTIWTNSSPSVSFIQSTNSLRVEGTLGGYFYGTENAISNNWTFGFPFFGHVLIAQANNIYGGNPDEMDIAVGNWLGANQAAGGEFYSKSFTNSSTFGITAKSVSGSSSIVGFADGTTTNTALTINAALYLYGDGSVYQGGNPILLDSSSNGWTGTGNNFLADDGIYHAGGSATNVLWALTGGDTLVPSPPVGLVSIVSTLADNATNVALNVETEVPWVANGAKLASFRNAGTRELFIDPAGGLMHGSDAALALISGSLGENAIAYVNSTENGDSPNWQAWIGSISELATTTGAWFYYEGNTNLTSFFVQVGDPSFNNGIQFVGTQTDGDMQWSYQGNIVTRIHPTVASTGSSVSYLFGTSNALTNGDSLAVVKNSGTNRFNFDASGIFTVTDFDTNSISLRSHTIETDTGDGITIFAGQLLPKGGTTMDLGQVGTSSKWRDLTVSRDVYVAGHIIVNGTTNNVGIFHGNGSPEGVITASPGSLYIDYGGENYIKNTGTGNTGWKLVTHAIVMFVVLRRLKR